MDTNNDPSNATWRLRAADVVWREVDGESLVLDLRNSTYFSVNGTATVLWRCLQAGAAVDALVTAVLDEYDIDEATARADVDVFLRACIDRDLVVPVDDRAE